MSLLFMLRFSVVQLVWFSLVGSSTSVTCDCVGWGAGSTQVAGGLEQMFPLWKSVLVSLGPYSALLLTDCGWASIFPSVKWV